MEAPPSSTAAALQVSAVLLLFSASVVLMHVFVFDYFRRKPPVSVSLTDLIHQDLARGTVASYSAFAAAHVLSIAAAQGVAAQRALVTVISFSLGFCAVAYSMALSVAASVQLLLAWMRQIDLNVPDQRALSLVRWLVALFAVFLCLVAGHLTSAGEAFPMHENMLGRGRDGRRQPLCLTVCFGFCVAAVIINSALALLKARAAAAAAPAAAPIAHQHGLFVAAAVSIAFLILIYYVPFHVRRFITMVVLFVAVPLACIMLMGKLRRHAKRRVADLVGTDWANRVKKIRNALNRIKPQIEA